MRGKYQSKFYKASNILLCIILQVYKKTFQLFIFQRVNTGKVGKKFFEDGESEFAVEFLPVPNQESQKQDRDSQNIAFYN